jgi:hypothetical protein
MDAHRFLVAPSVPPESVGLVIRGRYEKRQTESV